MSEKKKKVVQVAAESEQSQDISKAVLSEPPKEAPASALPFDLSKIDPKKVALAEEMGIPITELVKWTESVEARFSIIMENLAQAPQKVVEALKAEAVKSQIEAADRMRQGGGQGGSGGLGGLAGGLGALMPLLQAFGASGGGSSSMQDKMMEMMFNKTIQGMDLSNALTKAMIIKLAPSLADELTKTIIAPTEVKPSG